MKHVIGLLATAAGLYVLVIGALYWKQASLIYPAPQIAVPAAALDGGFADIALKTIDGLNLHAAYKPAREGRPTVIFFHGNGDDTRGAAVATRQLGDAGYGLMLVEYRGYAGNPGLPDEQGLYRDGRAAFVWLQDHGVRPGQIVAIGNSLGGGVATQLATEFPVAGLVLVSAFTSLPDVVAGRLRWAPIRALLKDRYDNLGKVRRLRMPVLIVHGDADTLIPVSHGVALGDAAARATLVRVPGVGHELAYRPQSASAIARWLEHLPTGRAPQ